MVRTVVTPDQQSISIVLPKNFIGKQVEVIAFTTDEAIREPLVQDKPRTHFASERTLAKDWLTQEDDSAWNDL